MREEPKGKVPSSAQRGEKKERLNEHYGASKWAGASKRQHPRRNGDDGTRRVGRGIVDSW